jgi:hypothetical protein
MLFALAFPIMASAMTGYRAETLPFIKDKDGNLISAEQFTTVAYVIHDGARIMNTNEVAVPFHAECKIFQ